MTIDICVPAFNEEGIIREALTSLKRIVDGISGTDFTIILADNGSTDATSAQARRVDGVSVLEVPQRGKGAAVVACAGRSQADIFGFIDADLSADPAQIIRLLPFLEHDECDIVIGSRLIDTRIIHRTAIRTLLSKVFNGVRKMILGIKVEDTQCGLKLMNARGRNVLARCTETGWFFDMEFLARAERSGLRIREVPVQWDEQRFPGRASKLDHVRDSIGALRAMFRIRRAMKVS